MKRNKSMGRRFSQEIRILKLLLAQKVWRRVIARSAATKQSHKINLLEILDCFASLAMTFLGTFYETNKILASPTRVFPS